MSVDQYIDKLTANGEISFTLKGLCKTLDISRFSATSSLKRLKKQLKIVSPSRGYYLILTPEFRSRGCLPAEFFIDDLMSHLKMDYYVCLISAAMLYGAAHQQPQMMQVMVGNKRRDIQCGRIYIKFIKNSEIHGTSIQKIKTRTGYIKVSTPEATAKDIIKYMSQGGGMSRIATVIDELAENIDSDALEQLAKSSKNAVWIRRLGYLLDALGYSALSSHLQAYFDKSADFIPFIPYEPFTSAPRNKKWRLAINTTVESDLNDSN